MDNSNLIERSGKIYWTARIQGKRYLRSTGFLAEEKGGWSGARKWRDRQAALARAGRIAEVNEDRIRSDIVTLNDCLELCRQIAETRRLKFGTPSVKTWNNYVSSLNVVLTKTIGEHWRNQRLSVLTAALVDDYRGEVITSEDPEVQARQRRTACSTLRQARQIFGKDIMLALRSKIKVPGDLDGFVREAGHTPTKIKYRMPPPALVARTLQYFLDNKKACPGIYMTYLLGYYLGLRAGEMAAARVEWIVKTEENGATRYYMDICRRSAPEPFKPKGLDHRVPIGPRVYEELMACKPAGPYFLPGSTAPSRHDLVTRDFAGVMRTLGWDVERYSKGAHELRKLAGANWYTKYGVGVAALWLGHSDIKTTYQYYSDLTVHPQPVDLAC